MTLYIRFCTSVRLDIRRTDSGQTSASTCWPPGATPAWSAAPAFSSFGPGLSPVNCARRRRQGSFAELEGEQVPNAEVE